MTRPTLIILGFSLLLVGSYLDNLRGLLLPMLTRDLAISYAEASWLLVLGNFASVAATLGLLVATQHLKEGLIVVLLALSAILTGLTAYWVHGLGSLLIWGTFLGAIISLYGGMSNVLIIHGTHSENRARFMCGLHTMYGVGSLLAPAIGARLIPDASGWRNPLYLLLLPAILVLLGGFRLNQGHTDVRPPIKQRLKLGRRQYQILFLFAVYVAGEVLISMWMPSYLLESEKFTLAEASHILFYFFVTLALARLLCFLKLPPTLETFVTWGSLLGSLLAFLIGILTPAKSFLALAGVIGPFFPLVLARVGREEPESARSMTLLILASMQLTLALSHFAIGIVVENIGVKTAYLLPALFLCLTALVYGRYCLTAKKH